MTFTIGARAPDSVDRLVDFDFDTRPLRPSGFGAKVSLATADSITMLVTSLLVMGLVACFGDWGPTSWRNHLLVLGISVPIWPTVFVQHKLYTTRFVTRLLDETRRVTHAIFIGVVALVVVASLELKISLKPICCEFGLMKLAVGECVYRSDRAEPNPK